MNLPSEIDPKNLVDTRIQLHWAAQILSSAADATLEKADDDSHSNLGWDSAANRLDGRVDASVDVVNFKLIHEHSSLDLHGKTLDQAMVWLGDQLGQQLGPREYEMPSHPVSSGAEFQPRDDHLAAIADWYTFGQLAQAGQGELRIWPHHFDLGFFQPDVAEGKSIGGGFSPGDEHYPLPYIYVNPYGVDRPLELPELEYGFWSDKWFGAVITAEEFNVPNGAAMASRFTDQAVSTCKQLLSA